MKRLSICLLLITFSRLSAFTQDLPKNFQALLSRSKMMFDKPNGLIETKVIENDQVGYAYALKYPKDRFEVRYTIMPLDSLVSDYEKSKKDTTIKVIEPNSLFDKMFMVTAMNAAGGMVGDGLPEIHYFDGEAVKSEFNADKGGTLFVTPGKEFGQKYKYCMIVGIHKDNVADAYYFYLADTKDNFQTLMSVPFHSLKFK